MHKTTQSGAIREPGPHCCGTYQTTHSFAPVCASGGSAAVRAEALRALGNEAYYDQLAPLYKLTYRDWETSVTLQALALHRIIREFFGMDATRILDAACGIGTQSVGLRELGYYVAGSDISEGAIAEARDEAAKRGLSIDFRVADMRTLWEAHGGEFDVVIACDDAIAHLPNDAEILEAFREFKCCTSPKGGCLISVRDSAGVEEEGRLLQPRVVRETEAGNIVAFDLWDADGEGYEMSTYILEDQGGVVTDARLIRGAHCRRTEVHRIERLLREAGFRCVTTLRGRFFQPLVIAMKARPGEPQ